MGQLEEQSILSLEFNKIKNILSNFAKLHQSQQLCFNLNLSNDVEEIKKNLQYTKEAKAILDRAIDIPVEFIAPTTEFSKDKLNSYLKEAELLEVAKALKTARLIKNFIKEHADGTLLKELSDTVLTNKELEDEIFSKFDEDNNVKADATPTLAHLSEALKAHENEIKVKISEYLANPQFNVHLQEQIYTLRDNRVVFPVMASSKRKVAGITHDFSATNKTAYIEPSQLIPLNNKIRECKSRIGEEILKILKDLTKKVKTNVSALENNENILAEIDFHFAKARYAVKIKAVEPQLAEKPMIKFTEMIHPLLIGNATEIVSNDFSIGDGYKGLIITGSNTGGKTVTLKTVGLLVLMMKAGLFVTAADAVIYPYEHVLADIGDSQNILQSLSTFSGHLKKIIEMLNTSNEKTLCLIDEICAGTDPQEGASLAEVILDDIATKGALSVTTTHFGELKSLEYTNAKFKNACVEFDKETLQPTYKLTIGIPGASNAIFIAGNLGLDPELVERAKTTLHIQRDPSAVIIEKLQETQQKLTKNLQDVEMLKITSQKAQDEYENKLAELRRDKRKTIKAIESKFSEEFDNVRLEIKDIMSELRKDKSEKVARRSYTRLSYLENDLKDQIDNAMDKQTYDELIWDSIKVGDTVMIKELNQPVTVVSLPDKNNNLTVQMGLIKTKISKDQVAKLDKSLTKKPQLKLRTLESFELKRSGMSNTLDLRGYKVDEALDSVEAYLDKASLANLTPVYIVHGNGTGALRNYIRDYVSTSPYVAKYRPGEPAEGGDGVTVIDLN